MLVLEMRTVFLIAFVVFLLACARKPEYMEAPVSGNEIVIDTSTLSGKIPVFYTLHMDGRRYDFFVQAIKGEVRSFIDACFRCAPEQKGFRVSGNRLRCRACDESFPLESLEGIGSCYPVPLGGSLRGSSYIINKEELIRKTRFPL